MAEIGKEKPRTKDDFDLRDDNSASDTGYSGSGRARGRPGMVVIFVIGLLVAGAFLAYGSLHRSEPGATESTSKVGGTR